MNTFLRVILVVLVAAALPLLAPLAAGQEFLQKPLSQWLKELAGPDAKQRRAAAFAIGKMGPAASAAVPVLTRALYDADPTVIDAAAVALGEIGPAAEEALPSLVKLVGDPKADPQVRRSAAVALGGMKSSSTLAVAALVKALDDPQPGVRQNAAWALGRLTLPAPEQAVGALGQKLADADSLVRRDVAFALGHFGRQARSALAGLLARLPEEKEAEVRKAILSTLVNLVGPEDGSALAALQAALQDPDAEAARLAAFALGNIGGGRAAGAVPVLRQALADGDTGVRRKAAGALANIGGEQAAPALPELSRALADADPEVQSRAALALAAIGPKAAAAVPVLAGTLRSPSAEVRMFAAEALSRIAVNLEPATAELIRLVKEEPNPQVRQRAVWALGRVADLQGSGAAAALESVLSESSRDMLIVRYEAARYLAHNLQAKTPDKAIDILTAMLSDQELRIYTKTDAKVQSGAENSGGASVAPNIGGDGRCLPAIALGLVGPKANRPEVIRALEECTRSTDPKLREEARLALRKIKNEK